MVERGGGGEKRKRLPANPTILENSGVCGQPVPSFPSPSPIIHFFCSCPSFLDEPRKDTLATQANNKRKLT